MKIDYVMYILFKYRIKICTSIAFKNNIAPWNIWIGSNQMMIELEWIKTRSNARASMLVKFKSNMHKLWWELTFSNINSLIRQIADESWPTKKSYTKVRLLKHIRLTHIVVTSTINKMFTQNMCLESLLRPRLGFWILEKLDFAGFWKSRFRTKYRWCCLDIWILVADFVYFDACIPSIPLLGFLSCYILHIVKKPYWVFCVVSALFFHILRLCLSSLASCVSDHIAACIVNSFIT